MNTFQESHDSGNCYSVLRENQIDDSQQWINTSRSLMIPGHPAYYCIQLEDLIAHDMFALLEAIQLSLALASARVREWVWGNLISGNNPTKHIHVQINVEVEVWGNLISGNRHYICMKIKYFGQSLIIDLSEINSPAKQTYLAYISCPASEVRTCKLHCRVRETPRLASCIAVYASEFGGI